MAGQVITQQKLIDANTDAETLSKVVNADDTDVISRLGRTYPTLAKALRILQQSGGAKAFSTLAAAQAAALDENTLVYVVEDHGNNGLYFFHQGLLVKSQYDPVNQAITAAATDATTKADTAKSEAITAAATDATTKADTAKSEAIEESLQALNVQRHDLLNLLSSLQLGLAVQNQAAAQQDQKLTIIQKDVQQNSVELLSLIAELSTEIVNDKTYLSNLYLALQTITLSVSALDANTHDKDNISKLYLALQKVTESVLQIETSKTALLGTDHVYTFPAPKSIAVIDIVTTRNPLPANKEEGKFTGAVTFTIDGESVQLFGQIEVQGQSSAGFPKKNWSFDLYADEALTTSALLKIGKVRAHDSVNFKANWVDHLHVRQMFNLELWQEIQNSRRGYPKQDIDNYYTGKTGTSAVPTGALAAPYMYPAVCNINGEFYGVGCIHYAKKRGNYNISKNKPKEILIDFGGITAIDDMNPSIIEIKAPSAPTADTLAAIQRWREFAQSSSDNIKANIASYGSKQNLIDYYCFVDFICGADIVFKNLMMYSWDAKIWRIGVYDVDMTYGLDADGTVTRFTPDYDAFQANPFWARIREAFKPELEARYAELRKSGLFSVDHVYLSMSHLLSFYPIELLNAEYSKWNPPSLSTTTFPALLEWVKQRLVFLDAKHNYTGN